MTYAHDLHNKYNDMIIIPHVHFLYTKLLSQTLHEGIKVTDKTLDKRRSV